MSSCGMVYIAIFMKTGEGVQVILWFALAVNEAVMLALGFMKYATEMSSSSVINIPSFIKIGSSIEKLLGGIHIKTDTWTHREQGYLTCQLLFFKIMKVYYKWR
jgi:hypothetical protein